MKLRKEDLPHDINLLHEMVTEYHQKMENMEILINLLREKNQNLLNLLYGRKSEKYQQEDGTKQGFLFPELPSAKVPESDKVEKIEIPGHRRKKTGRRELPEELPRIDVIHDLSESEKRCACGHMMSCIGEEVSEKLEALPATLKVARHRRLKYACKHCQGLESEGGAVKITPVPAQILPKSIATASLLAYLFVNKYCYSLPFYRQEKQFERHGFLLTRATMCTWAMDVAEQLRPLLNMLREQILCGPVINIDETVVQVLREPGRPAERKSFMWVFLGGPSGQRAVVYLYRKTRSSKEAAEFLRDYCGNVQTDGYVGYDFLDKQAGIEHYGCWAHARRKFVEVQKILKKMGNIDEKSHSKVGTALKTIGELYAIENAASADDMGAEEVYRERQQKSKLIVEKFGEWVQETILTTPPSCKLGEALHYTHHQWHRLKKYLDNGLVKMDNNDAENKIRPFVVGRKNWLFFEQPKGAEAGALLYSLIETAKENGLEPYKYLLYLFSHLPNIRDREQLKTLLPWNLTPDVLAAHYRDYWGGGVP